MNGESDNEIENVVIAESGGFRCFKVDPAEYSGMEAWGNAYAITRGEIGTVKEEYVGFTLKESDAVEIVRLRELNAEMVTALDRARQLAGIADDWNLGRDGKVQIDGRWVSCHKLRREFEQMIAKASS